MEHRFGLFALQEATQCIEMAKLNSCDLYNVSSPANYSQRLVTALGFETGNKYVCNEEEAVALISSLAEFLVWHLLLYELGELDERYAQNGKTSQWLSPDSPQQIDIIAVRQTEIGWHFHAIEVKWSEKCDYERQVAAGLTDDLNKLFQSKPASNRLYSHVSSLKLRLRQLLGPEGVEEVFSTIQVGLSPTDTLGVEFWGVFVSDRALNASADPDRYFARFLSKATTANWAQGTVRGIMLNVPDAVAFMTQVAMGNCS